MKFQDGTDFNAEAVCSNFDRWYNTPRVGPDRRPDLLLRQPCSAASPPETAPTRPSTSRARPTTSHGHHQAQEAVRRLHLGAVAAGVLDAEPDRAGEVPGRRRQRTRATRSTPPRTRPAPARSCSSSWERGKQITLERNDDYWGEKAKIDKAVIVAIDEPEGPRHALRNGEIDGYDLVGPGRHRAARRTTGFQIVNRDAVQRALPRHEPGRQAARRHPGPPGDRLRDQQGEIVSASMPEGTEPALEFMPPIVNGYTDGRRDVRLRPGEGQGPARGGRRRRARRSSSTTRPA